MEDNEFEEVTIISHTDHGTSVLPQSTAERLMKEIKLEVTQKISQNENVKLGSLQHSTTPSILDLIRIFKQTMTSLRVTCLCQTKNGGMIASRDELFYYMSNSLVLKILPTEKGEIFSIVSWGDYIFVFRLQQGVKIYNQDFQVVRTTSSRADGSIRGPVNTSSQSLYFRNTARRVTC